MIGLRAINVFKQDTGTAAGDINRTGVGLSHRGSSVNTNTATDVDRRIFKLNTDDIGFVFNSTTTAGIAHGYGGTVYR